MKTYKQITIGGWFQASRQTLRIGRFIVTTTRQGVTNTLIDSATTICRDESGCFLWRAHGYCILFQPWLRNKYGEFLEQTGLVVGWVKAFRQDGQYLAS